MPRDRPCGTPPKPPDHEEDTGFLKRFGRLVPAPLGRPPRERSEADLVALERQFLAERRAHVERELARLIDRCTVSHPGMEAAIGRAARQPLPSDWHQAEIPAEVALEIRPLRQELDVLDALEAAVARRPLDDVINRALRQLIEEDVELIKEARSWGNDSDQFWSNELVEQILSNLMERWSEWLRHAST